MVVTFDAWLPALMLTLTLTLRPLTPAVLHSSSPVATSRLLSTPVCTQL